MLIHMLIFSVEPLLAVFQELVRNLSYKTGAGAMLFIFISTMQTSE